MTYESILSQYKQWFAQHGDSNLGIGWPDQGKAEVLYQVMLEVIPPDQPARVLDFGCGPARMLDWMNKDNRWSRIDYTGLDFHHDAIELARKKYPAVRFIERDILNEDFTERFDYVILNGVLTMKARMSFDAMWEYAQSLLKKLWNLTERGIAFNVMSKAVDWERDDLFHLPTDTLIFFLVKNLSRRFIIRQDYAPYEYTVYVYR